MRRGNKLLILAGPLALVACAGGPDRATVCERLAVGPAIAPARMRMAGDEVATISTPIDGTGLPLGVRTTFDAIAPGGETTFVGREWGPRGTGYRLEKRYESPDGDAHTRSVLVDDEGSVLERSHSVPVPDVPQHVLAVALRTGRFVDDAHIVSGPDHEEYWSVVVHNRQGERFVVVCDLVGTPLRLWRRTDARVDAAAAIR